MSLSHRRGIAVPSLLAAGIALLVVLVPEGRLACAEPYLTETSPDGRWRIVVCGRPMLFAMPGSGSDAPGWIVLRDATGAIRGVSDLSMLQIYGMLGPGFDTRWTGDRVQRMMVFDLPLDPAAGAFDRWWTNRFWRLRAWIGWTPGDRDLS